MINLRVRLASPITSVKTRVEKAGGFPSTCVLHFNPYRNLFGGVRPDYYAATTDAYIVYPWEIDRGADRVLLGSDYCFDMGYERPRDVIDALRLRTAEKDKIYASNAARLLRM